MPPELTSTLLASPAALAVRVVASELLTDVAAGANAFGSGQPTGLHDLRVALRRLRSWLRAYRNLVNDTLRTKTKKRLRELAEATNCARDAEVVLEWIAAQRDLLPRERAGAQHLTKRLEHEREGALKLARATVERTLPRLMASLAKELHAYWHKESVLRPEPPILMASVTRDVLRDHADRLIDALRRIESPDDFKGIHRTRIAAKRLRYLLQALNDNPTVERLVIKLTALQDALGNSHDMYNIANGVVREIGETAARDARMNALKVMNIEDDSEPTVAFSKVRPGLTALARRAHENNRKNYEEARRDWRKREARLVLNEVHAYAELIGTAVP